MLSLMLIAAMQTATSEATIQRTAKSVFRVKCEIPAGGNEWRTRSSGSAFAWGGSGEVVTALHVVATCGRVTLESESLSGSRQATIVRAVEKHDLALLRVTQESGAPWTFEPLPTARSTPALWDTFIVVGYALGMPMLQPKRLSYHRRIELGQMVPAAVLQKIRQARWFDANTNVHAYNEGHLAPGHSGAPIVNQDGAVVAIAQGGLENGSSEISWGLDVAYLDELPTGATSVLSNLVRLDALFSAEQEATASAPTQSVRCGGARLTRIRGARLRDLRETSDDPFGLSQLETVFSLSSLNTGDFEYDIWRDLESGASIPVPRGMTPRPENGRCEVRHRDYDVALYFTVDPVTSMTGAQQAAERFQRSWLAGRLANIDPGFTYRAPLRRWDGLIANRVALYVLENRLINGFPTVIPVSYAFQSVSMKGKGSLGMVTVRGALDIEMQCNLNWMLNTPSCNRMRGRYPLFAQFVLGTHLAGWPRG